MSDLVCCKRCKTWNRVGPLTIVPFKKEDLERTAPCAKCGELMSLPKPFHPRLNPPDGRPLTGENGSQENGGEEPAETGPVDGNTIRLPTRRLFLKSCAISLAGLSMPWIANTLSESLVATEIYEAPLGLVVTEVDTEEGIVTLSDFHFDPAEMGPPILHREPTPEELEKAPFIIEQWFYSGELS
jgi:hypothetical protein